MRNSPYLAVIEKCTFPLHVPLLQTKWLQKPRAEVSFFEVNLAIIKLRTRTNFPSRFPERSLLLTAGIIIMTASLMLMK